MDAKTKRLSLRQCPYVAAMGLLVLMLTVMILSTRTIAAQPSTCYGTTQQGRLEAAVKLPIQGQNFSAYSLLAVNLGRTYVHSKVRDVIVKAYQQLATTQSNTQFVYGETGFEKGGKFAPHKTHQNGLSVDFMVPVRDQQHRSAASLSNIADPCLEQVRL